MRTVAYLRVSTAQQDVRSQRLAILEEVPDRLLIRESQADLTSGRARAQP
ncbi:MAG: hypothetical protein OXB99_16840 [Acidimicrobiaceae bacterium]|nr:hypothetical protein [Acidimicrobiaceae bacterium]